MKRLQNKSEIVVEKILEASTTERLRKIALYVIPSVLGAVAVKNVYKEGQTRHVSYWEASKVFFVDLLNDSKATTTRITGKVIYGQDSNKVVDVELDKRDYTPLELQELEDAFLTDDFSPR